MNFTIKANLLKILNLIVSSSLDQHRASKVNGPFSYSPTLLCLSQSRTQIQSPILSARQDQNQRFNIYLFDQSLKLEELQVPHETNIPVKELPERSDPIITEVKFPSFSQQLGCPASGGAKCNPLALAAPSLGLSVFCCETAWAIGPLVDVRTALVKQFQQYLRVLGLWKRSCI